MNREAVFKALEVHGLEVDEYFSALADQEKRTLPMLKATPGGSTGDLKRIRELSLVLRQILLHRAIELTRAAGYDLVHENGYALALSVRAYFETTASLGYLHYRLNSMQDGNISPKELDRDISILLLGSRDKGILAIEGAKEFEAKQILTMLEYADKSISKHIFGGTANEHKMLIEIYRWLCEFCHPNYHSNKLAFNINRDEGVFEFRHGTPLAKNEANIIGYLLISVPIFVELYDEIEHLAP